MKLDPKARYDETHEWVRKEEGGIVCGISDYAQSELGDVVYVELPTVGDVFDKGEVYGTIESVKAASDLYMPMGGEVVAVNEKLEDAPELVNEDPYGEGWIARFRPSDPAEFDGLLDGAAYEAFVAQENAS